MSKAAAALSKEDTKQDHPLQAIVLCDAWGEEARWGPLVRAAQGEDAEEDATGAGRSGEGRPWCLLPLLDVPLLAWTLECLVAAGVQEVFIFVGNGIEEVRAWLATSTYGSPNSTLSLVLRPTTASTPGDVLREVDSLGILAPADFLVVQVGYVGNIDLAGKVEEFGERRKKDPTLAMSCVVAPRTVPTTSKYAVHLLAPNNQLLHYEECSLYPKRKRAKLPREALEGGKEATARGDLESIGVQICSVEVPPLFTENFDYQFFYPDFVNGILTSDLLGKTICCTVIAEEASSTEGIRKSVEWAAVVGNTRTYDVISKSLLSRRAFPLAPDENLPNGVERYEARRGRVYLGKDLDLSRTSTVASSTLIGRAAAVGPHSFISHSVLAPNSQIGASCTITNSYIFQGAQIGNHCTIRDSIVGEDAVIGDRSVLDSGSLVGAGAKVGTGAHFVSQRVGRTAPDEGDVVLAGASLGENHAAYFWPAEAAGVDSDDSDDEDALDARNCDISRLGAQLQSMYASSSSSSLSSMSRNSSTTSLSTTASHTRSNYEPHAIAGLASLTPVSAQNDFMSECEQSLDRSFAEGHTVDNAAIELKTLRMASNVPLGEVRDVVIPFILKRCNGAGGVATTIERWGGLISSLTGNQQDAMADSLLAVQRFVIEHSAGDLRFFLRVLKAFYEEDVVTEEAVFAWYQSKSSRDGGGMVKLWTGAKPFVEALTAESESESE